MHQETQRTSEEKSLLLLGPGSQSVPNKASKSAFHYHKNSFSQMVIKDEKKPNEVIVAQISHFKINTKAVEERLSNKSDSSDEKQEIPFTNLDSPAERSLIKSPYETNNLQSSFSIVGGSSPKAARQTWRKKFLMAFKNLPVQDQQKVMDHMKSIMAEPSIFLPAQHDDTTPMNRSPFNMSVKE